MKERFITANKIYTAQEFPHWVKDGHWFSPEVPDTTTANGLTMYILKFLLWSGHRATRQNVQGRLIEKAEKQESGVEIITKKFIKSSTRTGTSDIGATIAGRSCQLEVKIGRDKPSKDQLREQALERKAGGTYEFIVSAEMFLAWYDNFVLGISKQGSIFD